jgi:hypothetical protein
MITDLITYEQIIQEVQLPPIHSQNDVDIVQNLLHIRRCLIERVTQIKKYQATAYRAQGTILEVDSKMDGDYPESAKMDLRGRKMEAQATIENCRLMTEQHWLELDMFKATLNEGQGT